MIRRQPASTGFDFGTGFGLIQADAALNEVAPECKGLPATIVGTEGRDIITGTAARDVIHGRGGNDVIRGFGERCHMRRHREGP
jgi:Ca2+-binding RTX toxin-like protein